jgi:tRNA-splicing ligase RtcB
MMVDPCIVEVGSTSADEYIAALEWCGEYAYAGRQWVTRYVATEILGANITDEIHNHHNFAWLEEHNGKQYWVVRKGATPSFPGQRGFIGGSMGDDAVIIRGVDSELSKQALYSCVHGAGRVMSRSDARGRFKKNKETGEIICKTEPRVNKAEMMQWVQDKGVVLRGADVDESPQAYRRLSEVLDYHKGTYEIETVLHPIGVAMAGNDIVDPYKD